MNTPTGHLRTGNLSALVFLLTLQFASLLGAAPRVEPNGYLRAGSGTNLKGGAQECFNNSGASSNEFRLANECGIFAEISATFHHKEATELDPSFFRTKLTFSFSPEGLRLYDRTLTSTASQTQNAITNRGVNLTEVFVEGGKTEDFPWEVWVGRRFYRDIDAHIFDFYYFGDMSGVGAGVSERLPNGNRWAIAHLLQGAEVSTDRGRPLTQALDFRWQQVLGGGESLNYWSALGWSPPGADPSAPATQYVAGRGWLAGARWNRPVTGGSRDLAIIYGSGLLQSLSLWGANPTTDEAVNRGRRWRAVWNEFRELSPSWAAQGVAAYEHRDSGAINNSRGEWMSLGTRWTYFLSDHRQILFEVGHSRVRDESENLGNTPSPYRELTRFTLAPQLSFAKSIWGRPVMRLFYSRSYWSDNNRSRITNSAPSHGQDLEGQVIGYQAEVWF